MNIVLYGATGMIGSRILDELVARGHHVTAVVRDPSRLPAHENVIGTAGDILDAASVAEAVAGAAVVVSAYGPGPSHPDLLLNATDSLIIGLDTAGVMRLVAVGGAGSLEVSPGVQLMSTPDFPPAWKGIARAHGEALELLRATETPGPLADHCVPFWEHAVTRLGSQADYTAVIRILEQSTGTELTAA